MGETKLIKIIVWGIGDGYNHIRSQLQQLEEEGDIRIVAYTGNEKLIQLNGSDYIRKEDIHTIKYDYILITTNNFNVVKNEAVFCYGISKEKIIDSKVLNILGFTFTKYIELINQKPTFISNNCTAGIIYNLIGMRFTSPIINMYIKDDDYFKLIDNFTASMESEIELTGINYDSGTQLKYPIYTISDTGIELNMNHYSDFNVAKEKWKERKSRINYDNLIFIFKAENQESVRKFNMLDIKKRILFSPYKNEGTPNNVYIDSKLSGDRPYWHYVNGSLTCKYPLYNVMELLLNQKYIPYAW